MKQIKFFDMDGTVTESRQLVSDKMRDTLNELSRLPVIISGAEKSRMLKQLYGVKAILMPQNGNETHLTEQQKETILDWIGQVELDMIDDRGCQISLSMVGHSADLELKKDYDPDGSKRRAIIADKGTRVLDDNGIQVKIAGTTCLDFFVHTKGQNITKLLKKMGWDAEDCIYYGDALYEGGNDESVIGIMETVQVSGPDELLKLL